jgi:hypothetical protein
MNTLAVPVLVPGAGLVACAGDAANSAAATPNVANTAVYFVRDLIKKSSGPVPLGGISLQTIRTDGCCHDVRFLGRERCRAAARRDQVGFITRTFGR